MNIQKRLLLSIIPVVLASILIITLISINISSRVIEDQVKENTQLLCNSYSLQLNNKIKNLKNSSIDISSAVVTAVNLETVLKDAIKRYPDLVEIYYTSLEGEIQDMAPYDSDLMNRDIKSDKEWQKAVSSQNIVVSDIKQNAEKSEIYIYTPVKIDYMESRSPQVVGILVMVFASDYFFKDIEAVHYGETGALFVINRDGYYLYNRDSSIIMEEKFSQTEHTSDLTEIESLMIGQNSGLGTFYHGNTKKFISFSPVYEAKWSMAITGSYSEFTSPINPIVFINIIILSISLIFSTLVIYFIVKGVSKPLIELTEATKKIAHGDFSIRTGIKTGNEIGELSKAFNFMVEKVQDFNKALELEVMLRTEDLTAANEELITMNESMESMNDKLIVSNEALDEKAGEIEAMNIELTQSNKTLASLNNKLILTVEELETTQKSLWSEMELAHKIQTVLLPEDPIIKGYEIGVAMKTNSSVGGDYYDVINAGGYDWFVIGDVSGHGVTAGLIMMMVQTSIHIVLSQQPEIDPKDLINVINKTIHNNIVKLGGDKYVTLTVFLCKGRRVYFSGAHLPVFIYRHHIRSVEVVNTDGSWIGLIDDIQGLNRNGEFILDTGDIILLYTDGITEGITDAGDNFSQKGLLNLFKSNIDNSPKDICSNIMNYTDNLEIDDDVTLMVIKRVQDEI